MVHKRKNIYGVSQAQLANWCAEHEWPDVHATSLFRELYSRLQEAPHRTAPALPAAMIKQFERDFVVGRPRVKVARQSQYDGSVKFVFELADGAEVESVLMPEKQRLTLCISSQVGCAQGCVFCHTGRMGLIRHLSVGEIIGQIVAANVYVAEHAAWREKVGLRPRERVTNIVYMGMGEPLDNVANVLAARHIMFDPYALGLARRRVSVSTAGHLDGLRELLDEWPDARVALSVHNVDDRQRSRIMPINRRWPLSEVLGELRRRFPIGSGHALFLQYTMIAGVNDTTEEAHRLIELCQGMDVKVNLIPLNPISASRLQAPAPQAIQEFRQVLYDHGMRVMVRYSKGQDIAAACGQLIRQPSQATSPTDALGAI